MNLFLKQKINPLLDAAGVSAVPMAARVVDKVGAQADKKNYHLKLLCEAASQLMN